MEFYKQLPWPRIPDHLLAAIDFARPNGYALDYGRRYYKNNQEIFAPQWHIADLGCKDLHAWLFENLPLPSEVTTAQQVLCASTHADHCEMIPHVDVIRSYAINYFVDTGGDGATTTWYQQRDCPVIRCPRQTFNGQQLQEGWVSYDDLKELAYLQVQPHTWYWFRTDIIHGVKNITGSRKYISLSE